MSKLKQLALFSKKGQRCCADPIQPKDIFNVIWPEGYEQNASYEDDEDSSLSPSHSQLKHKPFFVVCPRCERHILAEKKVHYGNHVSHLKSCIEEVELIRMVMEQREDDGVKTKRGPKQFLLSMLKANSQEAALDIWIRLVCKHNVPLSKIHDKEFRSFLNCEKISYPTLVDTLLQLSLLVEEKIAAEMKGKKGCIMHNGWSKYGRHYVCLLATYLADTGMRDSSGKPIEEPVTTLLACSTLPYDDTGGDGECTMIMDFFIL